MLIKALRWLGLYPDYETADDFNAEGYTAATALTCCENGNFNDTHKCCKQDAAKPKRTRKKSAAKKAPAKRKTTARKTTGRKKKAA